MYFKNRKPHEYKRFKNELKLFQYEKRKAKKEKIASKRAQVIMNKEFRSQHIKLDRFVTYYRGNVYLNKKSLGRLITEAKVKWGPSN